MGVVCVCVFFFFSLTFFPPCFSTMSVLSGKWSSWGVLEPPPLGIVQLSPRQASFTLPLHRHQPSGTKEKRKKKRMSGGRLATGHYAFFENTFTRCQTMQPLAVTSSTLFSTITPLLERKSSWEGGQQAGLQLWQAKKSLSALQADPKEQARSNPNTFKHVV